MKLLWVAPKVLVIPTPVTNLEWSSDRNIDEKVLYRQRSSDLLDLVPILVLLHEEYVRDVLRLARLNNVGKLRGIL